MSHAISCAVNFNNAGDVAQGRRIGFKKCSGKTGNVQGCSTRSKEKFSICNHVSTSLTKSIFAENVCALKIILTTAI
jgi:hypothetical protein